MWTAFASAFSSVIAILLNKKLLSKDKMDATTFSIWLFLLLCLVTSMTLPWLGNVNWAMIWHWHYVILFMVMILIGTMWNKLYYECMGRESMLELQLMTVFQPLLTIALAMFIFPEERTWKLILASIVSGAALIVSHHERWKIGLSDVTIKLAAAIFLAAIEVIYVKELLNIYSPAALYFVRTLLIFSVLFLADWKKFNKINLREYGKTLVIAILAVCSMVLSYYAYELIGVTQTTLILLLYPILTTIISVWLLGERIKKRKILAMIIVIGSIIITLI